MYHGLRSLVLVAIILSVFRATVPVQAAQDSDDFVRRFAAATEDDPVFGPVDGTFRTDLDSPDYDAAAYAGVFAEDVAVSVDFIVPHDAEDGGWNVFVEVRCGLEPHYRFRVYSNGEWTLSFNGYEADLGEALASGKVSGLKTEAGETNTIQLVPTRRSGTSPSTASSWTPSISRTWVRAPSQSPPGAGYPTLRRTTRTSPSGLTRTRTMPG